jgi:hypothetical protein
MPGSGAGTEPTGRRRAHREELGPEPMTTGAERERQLCDTVRTFDDARQGRGRHHRPRTTVVHPVRLPATAGGAEGDQPVMTTLDVLGIPRAIGARRLDVAVCEEDMVLQMQATAAEYGYALFEDIVVIDPDLDDPTADLIEAVQTYQARAVIVPSLPHLCALTEVNRVCGVILVEPEEPSAPMHLRLVRHSDDR